MTDEGIVALYREWSEDRYAAGFIAADPETVTEFRKFLASCPRCGNPRELKELHCPPLIEHDYERQMLEEFHRQERTESNQ